MKLIKQWLLVFCAMAAVLFACGGGYLTDSRSALYVADSGVGMDKRRQNSQDSTLKFTTQKLAEDGIHDPDNEAITVLQEPLDAMAAFPLDRSGAVDWSKALISGIITPRADVEGTTEIVVKDLDVTFKDTGEMPWVVFSHKAHTLWLGCNTCHDSIFVPKKGANDISMDGLYAGEQCGRCHGSVAFGLKVCERCHNTPQKRAAAGGLLSSP